ncbi:MAG: shikimate kinase [Clostridia bacterium]|nr:shikimate kinase [Clostridia bacterium]
MASCGLLGAKLIHSYSPKIHSMLGDYSYELFEKSADEVEDFILHGSYTGINVTIPYKKTVVPFMTKLSETAKRTGSVNTVVKMPSGILYGDNTDVYGFTEMVRTSGIGVEGKKTLVLGSGGASVSVKEALKDLGADPIVTVSRTGEDNYGNLERHRDAEIIVNATPVGMFPENGPSPVDLRLFHECKGVFDLIYNPARTGLLLQAEELGIPCRNGLYMLVAQAVRSSELFTDRKIDPGVTGKIVKELDFCMKNIVLIGMPGCGKSLIAKKLSELTGRGIADTDNEVKKLTGRSPADIIEEDGEEAFRRIETKVLGNVCSRSGLVIAAGGGAVTRNENYRLMHQNSNIVLIERPLDMLSSRGRPLSRSKGVKALYEERWRLYEQFADIKVNNDGNISGQVAGDILRILGGTDI